MNAVQLARVALSALVLRGICTEEYWTKVDKEIDEISDYGRDQGPVKAFAKGFVWGLCRIPRTAAEGARAFGQDYEKLMKVAQKKIREW